MVELKNLPPSSLNQPSIQTASTSAPAALPLPPPGRPTAPGHSGPLLAILDIREWLSVCVLQQPEQRERKNHGSCQLDRTHWRVTGDKEEGERGFLADLATPVSILFASITQHPLLGEPRKEGEKTFLALVVQSYRSFAGPRKSREIRFFSVGRGSQNLFSSHCSLDVDRTVSANTDSKRWTFFSASTEKVQKEFDEGKFPSRDILGGIFRAHNFLSPPGKKLFLWAQPFEGKGHWHFLWGGKRREKSQQRRHFPKLFCHIASSPFSSYRALSLTQKSDFPTVQNVSFGK